jgi:3-methyladenine DNA glycosylase AlkD
MAELQQLYQLFEQYANPTLAEQMSKYMAFQFEFYGIQKPLRQKLQKEFWKQAGYPEIQELEQIVRDLWQHDKREAQYAALDLLSRYKKQFPREFAQLFEYLITHKSWWDSVDILAATHVYNLFELYPDLEQEYFEKWLNSDNIWLQRTCLIYQLKRKEQTNLDRLTQAIEHLKDSNEFFIQKAIGWALREYSKVNPNFVRKYVKNTELPKLSRREALRYLNRKA